MSEQKKPRLYEGARIKGPDGRWRFQIETIDGRNQRISTRILTAEGKPAGAAYWNPVADIWDEIHAGTAIIAEEP